MISFTKADIYSNTFMVSTYQTKTACVFVCLCFVCYVLNFLVVNIYIYVYIEGLVEDLLLHVFLYMLNVVILIK